MVGLAALGRVVPAPSGLGAAEESLAAGRSIWWGWEGAQTEQEQERSWAVTWRSMCSGWRGESCSRKWGELVGVHLLPSSTMHMVKLSHG